MDVVIVVHLHRVIVLIMLSIYTITRVNEHTRTDATTGNVLRTYVCHNSKTGSSNTQ